MRNSFFEKLYESHQSCPTCPSPGEITTFFECVLGALFPDFCQERFKGPEEFMNYVDTLQHQLEELIRNTPGPGAPAAIQATAQFFQRLPVVYEHLQEDIQAMYEGDPAAKSTREVIRTYPGFYAICAYRLAHELHLLGVPGIPRVITEHAHSRTGIDIHPAARIGRHFCIDHGTGIVIGETALIGHHVKLYQGVTLGALSIDKKDAEKKRHPSLEDGVVVYAGATILGGETIVGHNSIIGGNVWLTRSVPPYSKVYYQGTDRGDAQGTDMVISKASEE